MFQADKRLQLIGDPLGQSFCVQLDVPMDDRGTIGRHEGWDVVRRRIQTTEVLNHTGFSIGIGVYPSALL